MMSLATSGFLPPERVDQFDRRGDPDALMMMPGMPFLKPTELRSRGTLPWRMLYNNKMLSILFA